VKCYILCIVLYGAENWTFREVNQEYLESLKSVTGEGSRRSGGPIV
jgi:hypothetical protein